MSKKRDCNYDKKSQNYKLQHPLSSPTHTTSSTPPLRHKTKPEKEKSTNESRRIILSRSI